MSRLTRKELKSDKFALEVQHSVEYVSEHRQQLVRWGGIAAGVLVVVVAIFIYRNHEHGVRQQALHEAMLLQNAQVGTAPNEFVKAFPTAADRQKALVKAFTDLAAKYPGTDEGTIAEYFLGTNASDQGNAAEAEKHFRRVVDSGSSTYQPLAKLALAQILASVGKAPEAEKLVQSVIDHPTELVSKETATIVLAESIKNSDPARARKLLEPLRSSPRNGVSRAALTALGELSNAK